MRVYKHLTEKYYIKYYLNLIYIGAQNFQFLARLIFSIKLNINPKKFIKLKFYKIYYSSTSPKKIL